MLNPDLIVDALVTALQGNPDLIAMLAGSPEDVIAAHDEVDSIGEAIATMQHSKVLVVWMGNEESSATTSELAQWIHRIAIFPRAGGVSMGSIMATICNGTGPDGLRFTESNLHQAFEQLGVPVFTREVDENGLEIPRIDMRFRQRGNE